MGKGGSADMYMKDGLHLSGKGAAVFADELSAAVDCDEVKIFRSEGGLPRGVSSRTRGH